MKRIVLVDGSLLLLLLLIAGESLLKGRHLITSRRRRRRWRLGLGLLRFGLIGPLIAVLLLICGFRLLALAVWMDFIIRICVVIPVGERWLHIVPRTAARPNHPSVVVLAVVSLVREVRGRRLLCTNWIEVELGVLVGGILLHFVWLAQAWILRRVRHAEVTALWCAGLVRLRTQNVAAAR